MGESKDVIRIISAGCDPGFHKMGYSIILGERSKEKVGGWKAKLIDFGVVMTVPSKEKQRGQIRVSSDDQRRLNDVIDEAYCFINRIKYTAENVKHDHVVGGIEWFTPFRSGGRGWTTALGVAAWYQAMRQADLFQTFVFLPMDIKMGICHRNNASKEDVIDTIQRKFSITYHSPKETETEQADAISLALLNLHEFDRLFGNLGRV